MKLFSKEKDRREEARGLITQLVDSLCSELGLKYNRISIRNQKTRLGSCSSKNNLNFNWQIIKFPQPITEHVVKHEVAHLKHQNHSRDFWNYLSQLDPDYKQNRKWLRENARKYIKF